jgi:hypothetical protein
MSASDRKARQEAVCGKRPGGASAYYYKESCQLKSSVSSGSTTQKSAREDRIDEVVNSARKELAALRLAARELDAFMEGKYTRRYTTPPFGSDTIILRYFLKAPKKGTVHERIERACVAYNDLPSSLSKPSRVVFNPVLEKAVLMSATLYYETLLDTIV